MKRYLMSAAGVWQLDPRKCAFNILNGPEPGPEGRRQNTPTTAPSCSSRTPIFQEIFQKPIESPQTMTIVQHSLDSDSNDIPPHPHHNHTTHFLCGWSKSTSTQFGQTVLAIPPGSSTSLIGLEAPNGRGSKVKGHTEWGRAHPTSKVLLLKARPKLRHQRLLTHTCTVHG